MTAPSGNAVAAGLFALVAALVGADLLSDAGSGAELLHLGTEALAALVALVGAAVFYRHHRQERREAGEWRARAEELLASSSRQVEDAFEGWGLSGAEREVALLLLKGLALKEIAAVRETSERTSREQARAVYKKAGVANRSELAGWFIEDLLPEQTEVR